MTVRYGPLELDEISRQARLDGRLIAVTVREFDLLLCLARNAQRVVSKRELLSVWAGTDAHDNTLQVHISALRRALAGHFEIKATSGVGYTLLERHLPVAGMAPKEAHLPRYFSPLIGREADLKVVTALLRGNRLITLTGPGGIGKTRLGVEAASSLSHAFPDGIRFVQFAAVSDSDLLAQAVATALGLDLSEVELTSARIAQSLGFKKLLIVLDNCEHLVAQAALIAERLLYATQNATILATSREPLQIEGECIFHVPPLSVPAQGERISYDQLLTYGAPQLLAARMYLGQEIGTPREAAVEQIASLCRRLDGMPLALELAAARASSLGIQEVLLRLNDRFALLNKGARNVRPQHQTLRATLDWSYELLTDRARAALRRLSVFAGEFSLEAGIFIAEGAGSSRNELLDDISSLVSKSLLLVSWGDAPGYRLLETTRFYALEKLIEAGELLATRRRHGEFHWILALRKEREWLEEEPDDWGEHYGCGLDDLRAALAWSASSEGNAVVNVELTAATAILFTASGFFNELLGHVMKALQNLPFFPGDARMREQQLHAAAGHALIETVGPTEEVLDFQEKAYAGAQALGDITKQLSAMRAIMGVYYYRGQTNAIHLWADRFYQTALRSSDPNDLSVAHRMLGFSRLYSGRYDEALAESARMLKTFVPTSTHAHLVRFRGDQRALGESLRAQVLWTVGKYEDARSAARMSVEIAQAAAHPPSLVHALAYAACPIYLLTGDPSETDGYLELLRNESAKHGFVHWQLWSRYYSGIAAARRQNIVTARRSLTEAFTELARAIRPIRLLPFLSAHLAVLEDEAAERFGRGIEQSLFEARKNQDAWALHELTRLHGVVMLQRHGNPELATHLFREAFNLARAQGALTYALRAAMSLQSCADAAGGSEDGRAALTDVLSHFVSNEPSPELLQAQQLL